MIQAQVIRDLDVLESYGDLAKSLLSAPLRPNHLLMSITYHSAISSNSLNTVLTFVLDIRKNKKWRGIR